jgi:hypothetical protein
MQQQYGAYNGQRKYNGCYSRDKKYIVRIEGRYEYGTDTNEKQIVDK